MQNAAPIDFAVLALELAPAVLFGFAGERAGRACGGWPVTLRTLLPAVCALPYVLISAAHQMFSWKWCAFYAVLPVAIAWLLGQAAAADPEQRANWRDALVLLPLGLAIDLRWLEPAWPGGLAGLGKLLVVDAALYGFVAIRRLTGTGFDFHFRWGDWKTGLRELLFFTPIVIGLGLALGFLHPHGGRLQFSMIYKWIYIFVFVAVPEELYFRAWVQNLLERRIGRRAALCITAVLFGLSHFNKRSTHFNWTYVFLASIAGIFYGRAWREQRRLPASAITHASVDAIWTFWF
ncbi:MAG TPA: CPBP family intramembrane glutamic endopeptidase [Terriglobales bacterium]|jgi:membrane protease YdiL (CAAX protease family)|nr:CPBP family intramembrane glutamic endopeptidase [Terriglobales bacterium]